MARSGGAGQGGRRPEAMARRLAELVAARVRFAPDSALEGMRFEPVVPATCDARDRPLRLLRRSRSIRTKRTPSQEGPAVRISSPPAESLSLGRIHFRRSRTPTFRAGVRGWLGDQVGRDAPRVS